MAKSRDHCEWFRWERLGPVTASLCEEACSLVCRVPWQAGEAWVESMRDVHCQGLEKQLRAGGRGGAAWPF